MEVDGAARLHSLTGKQPKQLLVLLGLMAAGEVGHSAVARGISYLMTTQRPDGEWTELPFTAVGFPRVFYLRYHGYRLYFPLLAMARYSNLRRGNTRNVMWGF